MTMMKKSVVKKTTNKKMMKAGGTIEDNSSFAKLAPPYNKATFADKIAGAKKNAGTAKNGKAVKKAFLGLGNVLGGTGKDKLKEMGKKMLGGPAGDALGGLMGIKKGYMKKGGKVSKAQGGIKVVPKNLNKRQLERVQRINETNPERSRRVANRISDRRNARGAKNLRMNGDAQFNMKSGGKMKKCKYGCK
jgi:hypothetical protein